MQTVLWEEQDTLREIVKRLSDKGLFIGFDQDKNAIATAKERLSEYSDRVRFVHSNFENIKEELAKIGVYKIDGVLADLGGIISSIR